MAYYFSYDILGLYPELQKSGDSHLLYPESKLHATMLYVHDEYKNGFEQINFPPQKSTIKAIEVWGTDKFYLVALLTDPRSELKTIHEQLKDVSANVEDRHFNPHISLQNSANKDELLNPHSLEFLIGLEVELYNFRCIAVRPKSKLKI